VELWDPLGPDVLLQRSRAYALTHSSHRLLQRLGLWAGLAPSLAPFRRLELCDRAVHRQVAFTAEDLRTGPDEAVGWIVQHQPLMDLLLRTIRAEHHIEVHLGTRLDRSASPMGQQVPVDLVVAADGHRSPTRLAAGLRSWGFAYGQGCLTVQVRLRGGRPDQAWELFRPEGPFAVLPLGDDAFQLVWSAPLQRLQQLEALDGSAFLDALSTVLPAALQADVLLDRPRAFPVGWELAWPLQCRGVLLLGEAAHRCHPVGGQGLNLCWRDVAELGQLAEDCVAGRLPVRRLPACYARRRWLDTLLVLVATDALVRLFSNRLPLLLPLRRVLLGLLTRLRPLRRWSLAAMTDGPCRLLAP
jgi:2-octaprenyl-6-methoxyphenol hydroxylase